MDSTRSTSRGPCPPTSGAGLLGYRIEVSEDGGNAWTNLVANTGNLNTEYSHKGLRTQPDAPLPSIGNQRPGHPVQRRTSPTPPPPSGCWNLPVLKDNEAVVWEGRECDGCRNRKHRSQGTAEKAGIITLQRSLDPIGRSNYSDNQYTVTINHNHPRQPKSTRKLEINLQDEQRLTPA